MKPRFEPARISQIRYLSELALRSKAHWPYDKAFIESCASELTISEEMLNNGIFIVALYDDQILGFYGFSLRSAEPEMTHLFVDPNFIGKKIGLGLWQHAIEMAKKLEWNSFVLVADPFAAEAFYFKVGCQKIGETPSKVSPDRTLPLLRFNIS
ncbi:MAG: GNAT family N-acetyltransferase [Oligoflexia bacterium]|nr:GNAT family N-acetyltransferase [Oligoflexia bacterium]